MAIPAYALAVHVGYGVGYLAGVLGIARIHRKVSNSSGVDPRPDIDH
jgi:hypothetical protein